MTQLITVDNNYEFMDKDIFKTSCYELGKNIINNTFISNYFKITTKEASNYIF